MNEDERIVSENDLEQNGEITLFEGTPFSGVADFHNIHGQKGKYHYKNGKLDGLSAEWYKNGQKELEGKYKDGKEEGLHTSWYENGQKSRERNYKYKKREGKLDGLWTSWYENGQKKTEGTLKDGKEVGLLTWW